MKKILQSITLVFILGFLFANTGFAQMQVMKLDASAAAEVSVDKDGEWIHWDSGESTNSIGTDAAAQFSVASRWFPADLGSYNEWDITHLSFVPAYADAEYTLHIWVGESLSPDIVYSQTVAAPEIGEWNVVELDEPFTIFADFGVWFGYSIDTQGGFPAGCDGGPQVAGKGNMILFGGTTWQELTDLNDALTYNWSIQAYVVPGGPPEPTYTVTFDVKDEDGDDIDNASIVLGPFEGGPGEYVFDGAPVGTHEYTVTAPGYETVTGEVEVVDEDVTVEVVMEEVEVVYHEVTFNVDMTDVEDFDPADHHVFLTGSFTDWAEPGSAESLQMSLVENGGAKDEPPYILYENFDSYDDFTTDLSPWITIQQTSGVTWGVGDFDFPGEGEEWAWKILNPSETDPPVHEENPPIDGDKYAIAIQYMDLNDDKWLISPEVSINETSELSFWGRSYTHSYGAERIRVLVSTSGPEPGNFIPISEEPYMEVPIAWTQYTFDLSDYAGQVIRFAINYVSEDAFIFMIDAILLNAEVDPDPDPDPEGLIFTVTTEVPEGLAEYKYFSDAFGEGWAGGEWEGDPDREVMITDDTTINDVWGEYEPPVSVVEVETDKPLTLYPNPASSILNISADVKHLAVYDITGRMLIELHNTNMVNVSDLRNGLYIIQVTTTAGTESHRFHVAR